MKTCHVITSCPGWTPTLAATLPSWRRIPFETQSFVVTAVEFDPPAGTTLVLLDPSVRHSRSTARNVGARAALAAKPADYLFFVDPWVAVRGASLFDKSLVADPDFVLAHDSSLQTGGRSFPPSFWSLLGTHLVRASFFEKVGGYDTRLDERPDLELYVRYAKHSQSYSILDVSQLEVLETIEKPDFLSRWRQLSRMAMNALSPWARCGAKAACDHAPYRLKDGRAAVSR